MRLKEILDSKGDKVLSIGPDATLADVVTELVRNRCGALVVCDADKMVGIISERDILRALDAQLPLDATKVGDRMTTEVVTGKPEDEINAIMGLMTKHRIRHLPILEKDKLAGVISIGDIVKAQHDRLSMENHLLMSYIQS